MLPAITVGLRPRLRLRLVFGFRLSRRLCAGFLGNRIRLRHRIVASAAATSGVGPPSAKFTCAPTAAIRVRVRRRRRRRA